MQYSELQSQIARRLDNRTDLSPVIYDYSQARIQYWSSYFFYPSDIVDTSLVTTPAQLFYNLPSGIRYLRRLRLLIGSNQTGLVIGQTTLSASITLPAPTIPVVSTVGFAPSGIITVGSTQVYYGDLTPTTFTLCVGVAPNPVYGNYLGDTVVTQLSGVWIDLNKVSYDTLINMDVLSPSIRSLPSDYAQIGLQFRLFPVASATYPLECTGTAAPAPPLIDTDDNIWTEDFAWLVIASTANEIRRGYLHEEASQQDMMLERLERRRIMKTSMDVMDNTQIRSWI